MAIELVPEREDGERFDVTDEEKALLLDSLEQARRGEGIDGWELLDQIRAVLEAPPTRRI